MGPSTRSSWKHSAGVVALSLLLAPAGAFARASDGKDAPAGAAAKKSDAVKKPDAGKVAPPPASAPKAKVDPLAIRLGKHVVIRPGGQYRIRFLGHGGRNFGPGSYDTVIHRARLSMRARVFGKASFFVQLQDVRAWGSEKSTVDFSSEGFDLHQGYGQVDLGSLMLRAGRQEIDIDGQRIIGSLNWADQARSFDGVLVQAKHSGLRARAFWFRLQEEDVGLPGKDATGADIVDFNSKDLFGLHLRYSKLRAVRPSVMAFLDLDKNRDRRRITLGAWVDGMPAKGLWYRVEAYYQGGTTGRDSNQKDISAYLVSGRLRYTLPLWGKPTFAAWFDIVSGDSNQSDSTVRAFDTLFGTNHKFYGFADYFLNIPVHTSGFGLIDTGGRAMLRPTKWLKVLVDVHHFRFAEDYTKGGESLSIIGNEIDTIVVFPINKMINVQGGFAVFVPSRGITCLRGGCNSDASPEMWGYLMAGVKL